MRPFLNTITSDDSIVSMVQLSRRRCENNPATITLSSADLLLIGQYEEHFNKIWQKASNDIPNLLIKNNIYKL